MDPILQALEAVSTIVVAVATGVLAWRELARRREARRSADERIRAIAWDLSDRLFQWESEPWPDNSSPEAEKVRFAKRLRVHFAGVRQLLSRITESLPDASPTLAHVVRVVYSRVIAATNALDRVAELNPGGAPTDTADRERLDAFRENRSLLETSRALLDEEIQDFVDHLRTKPRGRLPR